MADRIAYLLKMNAKEFKAMFSELAKAAKFQFAYGGWFKESPECIVVLDLQKSHFGDYFELNIKIFIQKLFGKNYTREKDMVKKLPGDVFWRAPEKYKRSLDLEDTQSLDIRKIMLGELFESFILPTTAKAQTRSGIADLKKEGLIYLLPAVEAELLALRS